MHIAHTELLDDSKSCGSEAITVAKLRDVERDLRDELDSAQVVLHREENDAVCQRAHFEVALRAEKARAARAEERASLLYHEFATARVPSTTETDLRRDWPT